MAKKDNIDSKTYAFIGVLLPLIGFIIVMIARDKDRYAKYYGKQGLMIFIMTAIVWSITILLLPMGIIGWIINTILWISLFTIWFIGLAYSISGVEKAVPLIGSFAKLVKY